MHSGMKRISILFFICSPMLFAQQREETAKPEPRVIGVDEAVSLALQNNLSLQAGKVSLEKKKRPADLAWNQFLPAVSAQGTLAAANKVSSSRALTGIDIATGMPRYTEIEGSRWSLQAALSIQWQGLNIAMAEGVKQLKQAYAAGEVTYAKAKLQLEQNIRKLYNSILLANENLHVQEQSYALAEEQVRTATANYRAGLSPELTLLQARLNRDKLSPDIDVTRNNLKVSMANFALLLGLPYDTEFKLIPAEERAYDIPGDTAELIRKAAGSKIDIQELRANIRTLRISRNAIRWQLWTPSLNVGWSLAPAFSGDPFKDSWSGDAWSDRGSLSLQLVWSLNGLLPFTTQAASLRDMEDDLRVMDINLAQSIRQTEVDVYNQVFLISQARESIIAQQKTVELAERTYNDTLAAFRAGLRDFMEVQNVEQQLRQARLGVLQQQYNLYTLVTDLEYAIGVPFGSLLE